MNDDVILEIRHLTKEFPGVRALDDVSMDIRKGEVHALLGENGAGKSTLIKIIAGVYTKDDGEILLNGNPCNFAAPSDAFGRGISVIHQETSLIPELTAVQNVFLGIEPGGRRSGMLDNRVMKERYAEICSKLDFFIEPDVQVKLLSVAEKKIIEIIKALMRDASLLIMDEPTDSLTGKEIERLYGIIRDLRKHGATVIYITHYMDEVFDITDRATVMKDGRHVLTDATSALTSKQIISAMVGRDVDSGPSEERKDGVPGKAALEVHRLSGSRKFTDISLSARYGEILGITGVIGSGKTELFRAVFGADSFDSGFVVINGRRIRRGSPENSLRCGMGMLPEDRKTEGLLLEQEVYKNLTLSRLQKDRSRPFLNRKAEYKESAAIAERLNIKLSGLDHMVKYLSGGNQQKVVIGKWLMADPDIIIMDEPTRGIDVGAKGEIYRIMKQLASAGKCIIFISSEVPEIINVSDRILLMKKGRIAARYERGVTGSELFHAMLEDKN